MKMGVVADDVTGSNDIGIMFAKSGYLTHVYSYKEVHRSSGLPHPVRAGSPPGRDGLPPAPHGRSDRTAARWGGVRGDQAVPANPDEGQVETAGLPNPAEQALPADECSPDILILDTNSRLDPPQVAYRKVFAATRELQQAGCSQFHNKTCSVFRGNIGAEFDAMLDALGLEFAVVVLGFPKNGRTTVDGIHYVHGKRLEDSEFRQDPIHPMLRSDLVGILGSQTKRKVALVTHAIVEQGAEALRDEIQRMRAHCQYLILDVTDQPALQTIARAVHDEPVLCGSSAIAEELPAVWGPLQAHSELPDLPLSEEIGILVTSGSLMPQTATQIEHLQNRGASSFVLNTSCLFDTAERESEVAHLSEAISNCLRIGNDVIFHSPNDSQALEKARQAGTAYSASNTDVSRLVSAALAEVTARTLEVTGQNRLVVAGGETSAAICDRLGVEGMRVWKEIQPGLPSCVSLNNPPRLLVLKSGSFGKPDFFERALEHLREAVSSDE